MKIELELHEVIASGLLDFDEWMSLISEIEKTYPENIEKICLVYESFLSKFPLCYGYWRKYAYHKIHFCGIDKGVEVFERAVQSATFSVDVWVDYCSFGISAFEDPSDVRRLFKRGMSFVGKDYLSHVLWDKYIEYEFSQQQWSSLAFIYIQTLQFPTKKLRQYYDSFKKLVAIWEEEMKCHTNSALDAQPECAPDDESSTFYEVGDVMHAIEDMLNSPFGPTRYKALQKYISFGERFYQEACKLDEKISFFERNIRRSYFHIKPLDVNQLENWHNYLNFIEVQGDFDWAAKLYERCLIPCANYPEFWMRYTEFMESKGGREAANFSMERATQTFIKRVRMIHLFNARHKEYVGDLVGARAALLQCDQESDTEFVQNVVIKANMERRQGNFTEASNVFKEALKLAELKEKSHTLPNLYVHFSRLQYMITDSADAARDVLIEGIKHMPSCKLLLEELIKLSMMNGGSRHINEVEPIIANSISLSSSSSQSLSTKDVEDVSNLYLEFVDLCGNVKDVMKGWHQHIKLFPHCVRTASFKHPGASSKPWKLVAEARKETLDTVPPLLSDNSDHRVQSPFQEEKLSSSGNPVSLSDHDATSQILDQNPQMLENCELLFEAGAIDPRQSEESEIDVQETAEPVCSKFSEHPREDAPEPNMLTLESAQKVTNDGQIVQSSQEYFEKHSMQQQNDLEPEQDLRPPSLEKLCLDSQSDKSRDLIPKVSDDCEADIEISFSNGQVLKSESPQVNSKSNESMIEINHDSNGDHFVSSTVSTRIADSPKSHSEYFCHSTDYQSTASEAHSSQQMHVNGGGNWRQRSNSDRNRKDSRYGFHGHSHRRFHQRQQLSPQKQYQRAEMGTRIPVSQSQTSQLSHPQNQQGSQARVAPTVPAKTASPQAWSVQNVQYQNFASANQSQPSAQPAGFPQAHMVPHITQSSEQHGDLQNNQAYNQMWQYYYYQQQQQQQFLMQQQPHQQQQLLQQQYQQQQLQLQQQYLQQQQLQQQQLSDEQPQQLQQQQDQQQPLQMQQQQQFLQQQQQWQLQYQQQFLQQQYPYQLQQHQLQQQQHILYLQQQQLQIQQSQQQQSEHQLQNHLYHQQQQEELSSEQQQEELSSEQQQQLREREGTLHEEIKASQNNCKQEALAEARQHVASQGPGLTPPPQSAGFPGASYVISPSKESHSPQSR
ncbi:hypothetical protein HS088_TW13G01193 [Tripterygium wilfordii]|uniref:Pre-mRNA-processing factor 39 n=1 Tax=Tripterygium wilfordii TaxID=458696 RepID=A0A7J7CW19_TRIWF|nr:hypothetical protein HS088_TW13G01193 [Tripterygium wilfordii]